MLATLLLFATPPGGQDNRAVISFMIQMALIFGIIYFMMIRPRVQQEKKHKERLGQLKKGDQVVTAGGIMGEVIHLKDEQITIRSGDSRMIVQRERITEVRSPAALPSESPSAS